MTFLFFDLETSGIDARWQRIMQFAGQRTDKDFKPLGEPINVLVKLSDEVLPDPGAIMVTGITPQKTLQEGITEAEFCRLLEESVFTPDTVALGYNSIRFDDEFIRHTLFRNFYDPYEREWSNNRGRWDILDAVRMMRALRPDGIKWPLNEEGKPTNRLEELSKANKLDHANAHDALADVNVTIEIARLFKRAQPKLFEHLFAIRDKQKLSSLLDPESSQPLVHSSGRFGSENLNTSVIMPLTPHPANSNAVLVYDLRYSPRPFADFDANQLAEAAFTPMKELAAGNKQRLPVKAVHINKSPALAPMGVLDEASQQRINLTLKQIDVHRQELLAMKDFAQRVMAAWETREEFAVPEDIEGQLYQGFFSDPDKKKMAQLRAMTADELAAWQPAFNDERLTQLFVRYKARNYPETLSGEERQIWEEYRAKRLSDSSRGYSLKTYMNELAKLAEEHHRDKQKMFLLQELQLYAQSIMPFENEQLL